MDSDQDQTLVLVATDQLLEVRDRRLTRPSPMGPKIENDDITGKRLPIYPFTFVIEPFARQVRRSFAFQRVLGRICGAAPFALESVLSRKTGKTGRNSYQSH